MFIVDSSATWLVDRVDQIGRHVEHMRADELRSLSMSTMDRRQRGEESPELLATALACSGEGLRRTSRGWPKPTVIRAVIEAMDGVIPTLPAPRDRQAAVAMALYWHSLAGKGVHLMSLNDRGARAWVKRFTPAGELLGCDVGCIAESMSEAARRTAYRAMVTFGSYSKMAADYLRDNLYDSQDDIAHREFYAAVVDDVRVGFTPLALSHVCIAAPSSGQMTQGPDIEEMARSFRRDCEYRRRRAEPDIIFTADGIALLKSMVGWTGAPSLETVSLAERIENALVRREGLDAPDGRASLAEVSLDGYLRIYPNLTGFSSKGVPGTLNDILMDAEDSFPSLRELAIERLFDNQRSKTYSYRSRIRRESDVLALVHPIVSDMVEVWLTGGADALITGVCDALTGHQDREEVENALRGATFPGELPDQAIMLIERAIERRKETVGVSQMATILRHIVLTVVDVQWREHICRLRFLQRQSGPLYGKEAGTIEERSADVNGLFAACEQKIRFDSIKYLLNLRP